MTTDSLDAAAEKWVEEILGYLNLSSGASNTHFLGVFTSLFGYLAQPKATSAKPTGASEATPAWRAVQRELRLGLRRLAGTSKAFEQVDQAEAVVELVFEHVLPGYREHHRDLLFHQTEESLFQPFFIGRACEAMLAQGGPWDRDGADHRGRDHTAERLHRLSARAPSSKAGRSPTVRPRVGAADPAVRPRGGPAAGRYARVDRAGDRDSRTDRSAIC